MSPLVAVIATYFGFDLISTNFDDDAYFAMRERLVDIKCVNDVAERAVKLAKEFNEFGPRDEESHQKLLKTVSLSRKRMKSTTKKGMAEETSRFT